MKNFKLTIEYDGSSFYGWQRQKKDITIQGEIEKALSIILNKETKIIGAGRTDAGVHAYGQVANFKSDTRLSCDNLQNSLNSLIKHPIIINDCTIVPDDFHSQYSSVSKEYHYHILNRNLPCAIGQRFQWHIKQYLDVSLMNRCCEIILGSHDFKSFENSGSPRSHTIRTIYSALVEKSGNDTITIKIIGNGFLKNMVRNLTGTMVLAGHSKISPDDFKKILDAKDRGQAGATAPAKGLFLMAINY